MNKYIVHRAQTLSAGTALQLRKKRFFQLIGKQKIQLLFNPVFRTQGSGLGITDGEFQSPGETVFGAEHGSVPAMRENQVRPVRRRQKLHAPFPQKALDIPEIPAVQINLHRFSFFSAARMAATAEYSATAAQFPTLMEVFIPNMGRDTAPSTSFSVSGCTPRASFPKIRASGNSKETSQTSGAPGTVSTARILFTPSLLRARTASREVSKCRNGTLLSAPIAVFSSFGCGGKTV